jgi:hypothetical protein
MCIKEYSSGRVEDSQEREASGELVYYESIGN